MTQISANRISVYIVLTG